MTVLFADVVHSMDIAKAVGAERLREIMAGLLDRASAVVSRYGGTVDKFTGDGLMAIFGAPVGRPDDAARAVTAGLDMIASIRALDAARGPGGPALAIGIGVHTGPAIVGNIGSEKRLDYTAVGDTVNLASRIEGLTKEFGAPLLVSRATRDAARASPGVLELEFDPAGESVVKGRTQAVELFTVRRPGVDSEVSPR